MGSCQFGLTYQHPSLASDDSHNKRGWSVIRQILILPKLSWVIRQIVLTKATALQSQKGCVHNPSPTAWIWGSAKLQPQNVLSWNALVSRNRWVSQWSASGRPRLIFDYHILIMTFLLVVIVLVRVNCMFTAKLGLRFLPLGMFHLHGFNCQSHF